jgi:hypothetical protein
MQARRSAEGNSHLARAAACIGKAVCVTSCARYHLTFNFTNHIAQFGHYVRAFNFPLMTPFQNPDPTNLALSSMVLSSLLDGVFVYAYELLLVNLIP